MSSELSGSEYACVTAAASTQPKEIERSESPRPDYIDLVEHSELSFSVKSDYVDVSEADKIKKNVVNISDSSSSLYCEINAVDIAISTSEYERPVQIVPPTIQGSRIRDNIAQNTQINKDTLYDQNEGRGTFRQYDDIMNINKSTNICWNKRCLIAVTVVVLIITGLVIAVIVQSINSEKDHSQSTSPVNKDGTGIPTTNTTLVISSASNNVTDTTVSSTVVKATTFTTVTSEISASSSNTSPSQSTSSVTTITQSKTSSAVHSASTSTSSSSATSAVTVSGYPTDCKEIRDSNVTTSKVYAIYPFSRSQPVNVMCDMTRDNGGWTMFQRRFDGSVDFYRSWQNYKNGFGNVAGEHWLGNDILHQLTALGESFLYVVLEDFTGNEYVAKYSNFTVASETDQYRMWVSTFTGGTAGNAIQGFGTTNVNGHQFSTYDRVNDHATASCAVARHGAWW